MSKRNPNVDIYVDQRGCHYIFTQMSKNRNQVQLILLNDSNHIGTETHHTRYRPKDGVYQRRGTRPDNIHYPTAVQVKNTEKTSAVTIGPLTFFTNKIM